MITREIAQASLQAKPLGEVAEFLDSRRKPVKQADRKPGPYPYYGANGQQGTIDGFIFDEPLILLAEDGGFFDDPDRGIAYRIQGKSWVNNHAHVIKPKDGLDLSYLCRVLENYDVRPFINGSTRSKLTKTQASQIPIPLPPLDEQKRIAAILDQTDALRRLRQRAIDLLNTLGQAIFHEMFGEITNAQRVPLSDVIDVRSSLADPKQPENADLPHVGPEHIASGSGRISWERVVSCKEDGVTSGKYVFEEGDVIYSKIRPYLDKVAIADRKGMCSADMYALNCKIGRCLPSFVHFALGTSDFLSYAAQSSGRANIPKINRKQLLGYAIPLPTLKEQEEFENKIQNIEDLRMIAKQHSDRTEALFASLQSRAFRGEL